MKEKTLVNVPKGTQYIGQIPGFELPAGLFNKAVTGCGGTEACLAQKNNNVIASPRVQLLVNKNAQHPDDTLLVVGTISVDQIKAKIEEMHTKGIEHIHILVTYDGLRKVVIALGDECTQWDLLVDEYQLLLLDAGFKSEVGLKVLELIGMFRKATLMSATPLMDEVVAQIPELRDMPYTELVWGDVKKVTIKRIKTGNPKDGALAVIRLYKEGNYPSNTLEDGTVVESKEMVLFINSVQTICNLVLQAELPASEVNILCGSPVDNDRLLAKLSQQMTEKLGSEQVYENGSAPLRGEEHKKYTFCTSTAYCGVDFYSSNACTFVINDIRCENTSLSIEYELTQIVGRQRLTENPFKDYIYLIYNSSTADADEAAFEQMMSDKLELTQKEIANDNLTEGRLRNKRAYEREKEQKALYYSSTWNKYDRAKDEFVLNHLKMLSERHAFHVQKQVFTEGVLVTELQKTDKFTVEDEEIYYFDETLQNAIQRTSFQALMERYVLYKTDENHRFDLLAKDIAKEHPEMEAFYSTLGAETCSALQYRRNYLEEELLNRKNSSRLIKAYVEAFPVGSEWTTKEMKDKISSINAELSLLYRGKPRKGQITKLVSEWGFDIRKDKKTSLYVVVSVPNTSVGQ